MSSLNSSHQLSKRQYQVLNSCADDWELFYFPFAEVNYGGQVFRRNSIMRGVPPLVLERLRLRHIAPDPSRYEDAGAWRISVSGREIANDIVDLFGFGMLGAQRIKSDQTREPIPLQKLLREELHIYTNFRCLTFDDHFETYGYGPHEFMITQLGVREIEKSAYREYDKELGWPLG
jgi:hypothetical protein